MKYVLDSSVAVKWVLSETDSDKARKLRDEYVQAIHELLSPDIFPAEVAHSLTRAERQNRITVGEAETLWQVVMLDRPLFEPYLPIAQRAIQISSDARIGFYDCLYVALAERESCELVTADDRLVTKTQANLDSTDWAARADLG